MICLSATDREQQGMNEQTIPGRPELLVISTIAIGLNWIECKHRVDYDLGMGLFLKTSLAVLQCALRMMYKYNVRQVHSMTKFKTWTSSSFDIIVFWHSCGNLGQVKGIVSDCCKVSVLNQYHGWQWWWGENIGKMSPAQWYGFPSYGDPEM